MTYLLDCVVNEGDGEKAFAASAAEARSTVRRFMMDYGDLLDKMGTTGGAGEEQ